MLRVITWPKLGRVEAESVVIQLAVHAWHAAEGE
jgi:hypothetical protein